MKCIDQSLIGELLNEAREVSRKRMNHNLHPSLDDKVQRFVNAMQPDTYVRPHCHFGEERWELFIILRGEVNVLCFDDSGKIANRKVLNANSENVIVEIPGDTWHTLVVTKKDSLVFECKSGPYIQNTDKNFAQWAPKEFEDSCEKFIDWFENGAVGSLPPTFNA